ncbi:MAG: peptidylprolyl isomerase [Planctomycetes bacterium]|nr:peptidylprolyl isomerase [Planctomycetota bacterium]
MAWTKIRKQIKPDEPLAASQDAHRDVLPRTGLSAGAQIIDGLSKFLAGYGKILAPAVLIVIAGLTTWWIVHSMSSTSELELRNKIDRAASVDKLADLPGKMEEVIAEADQEGKLQAYAQYRYAVRAYDLMARPYKADEVKKVLGIFDEYLKKYGESEQQAGWNSRIKGLQSRLASDAAFLEKPDTASRLPWDHNTKFDRPKAREVDEGNPIVVFRTSVGDVRFELFENDAENAVKHLVSLCEEGFFDRSEWRAQSFSNAEFASGPYRGASVVTTGREGRPVGVELKRPTTAKDGDDVDLAPAKNPYTIAYEGSDTRAFEAGTIALGREETDPSRARTDLIVVLEPSSALDLNFKPLGKLVGGQDVQKAFARLANADIYYTFVEQKRKGVKYLPMVHYDGWPVATQKREKTPEPVRFGKIPLVIDDRANPLVVLELESGDVLIELFEDIAPNTVKNFINMVEERFYDIDCEFYRILGTGADLADIYRSQGERIIQGGNDQSKGRDKYDYYIRNEAFENDKYDAFFGLGMGGIANSRGTISMARIGKNDGQGLDGASTEFFINLKDHPNWDTRNDPYCVFGRVIEGLHLCAQVKQDDPILSAKVIRKRSTKYVPEVKYKSDGLWKEKEKVTPPTEEDIKKAREEAKKKADKPPAMDRPSMPGMDGLRFGG